MSFAWSRLPGDALQGASLMHSIPDKGHQVDESHVPGAGVARLGALQHDRAERARGDDGLRARAAELLEPDIADSSTRFLFLVGKQEPAAGSAAEWVRAIPLRLSNLAAELCEQPSRFVDLAGVASQV